MPADRIASFTRSGLRFDVTDGGPLDGPVVVLLHGFPGSRQTWSSVAPLLHDAGLRTLAFDQRGYSREARPPRRSDYRAAEVSRDVLGLIDAVGAAPVHLVGHDWGGFVAWHLAAVAPARLASMTVLSTPHPRAMLASLPRSAQLLRSAYMGFFQLPRLPEAALRGRMTRMLEASGLPASHATEYERLLQEPGALTGALNWYRGMALPDRRDRGAAGRPVRVPTTYVWGKRDFALGRHAAELTERQVAAGYRFVELDETHWLPELAPERVAAETIARVRGARG
ncbi:alpha/beta fold hydrolase [Herbiconiux sp. SYSU D00978]|uniref:alpha/beta fold hydrolase n=1 Tax=Herbiconiux sp. SYSU D00978 TaxID=2812562 RepID=UPI0027DC5336|nr:alpha/beta fold hydrolase [Herbiconiux sp. SYSU D00978]